MPQFIDRHHEINLLEVIAARAMFDVAGGLRQCGQRGEGFAGLALEIGESRRYTAVEMGTGVLTRGRNSGSHSERSIADCRREKWDADFRGSTRRFIQFTAKLCVFSVYLCPKCFFALRSDQLLALYLVGLWRSCAG